jgi:hypothetical protein
LFERFASMNGDGLSIRLTGACGESHMLKVRVLGESSLEIACRRDQYDRASQAQLECEFEGSATIGRVSQILTPSAVTDTLGVFSGLISGKKLPAP